MDTAGWRIAFVGAVGIPNRYGGFEAFLEQCGPVIAEQVQQVLVTCDHRHYPDREPEFRGVRRFFITVPANGAWSILHDLVAFLVAFPRSSHIVILGVSGGIWFPFFRVLCALSGKRLLVNIDGVEWQRGKFSKAKKLFLRMSDAMSQLACHTIVYDNAALKKFVLPSRRNSARLITYSGDHVIRIDGVKKNAGTALTICRIEPENNIEMIIEGFVASSLSRYCIVGNWEASEYGRNIRKQYANEPRLSLLDSIYDPLKLAELREACSTYIHGHTVGGTNPSLVEMLFYDCRILCFDVPYHHETAGTYVEYFASAKQLANLLSSPEASLGDRSELRARYTREVIASEYLAALAGLSHFDGSMA